jgi:hypothetical protein
MCLFEHIFKVTQPVKEAISIPSDYYQWTSYQCVTSYAGNLPIVLHHPLKSGIEITVFVTNK